MLKKGEFAEVVKTKWNCKEKQSYLNKIGKVKDVEDKYVMLDFDFDKSEEKGHEIYIFTLDELKKAIPCPICGRPITQGQLLHPNQKQD